MPDDLAIKVVNVSKTFKLPHEKQSTLKGALINVFRANKGFEKQKALNDITFDVKNGDFFAIVGRNGSGKSTLLKMLAGIYSPDNGRIDVNGKLTPFIELGVGFNQELSGRENVFLNGALLGFNRKEMEAMYQDIVDFAEIERFMDQKLKNYSSGMQVRLAFSIAIRARSDILLLDEVLAVGDAAFQQKCFDYFEKLKRDKKTVVFVTHDMGAVRRFCTKAIYIENGKITHNGKPTDIADIYLEENMESSQRNIKRDCPNLKSTYSISTKILEQTKSKLLLEVSYKSKTNEETYIGISVIKDGVSIAEITTALDRALIGDGTVTYSLDISILNGGVYEIAAALFGLKNRNLLATSKQKSKFILKSNDVTKGAALKLADSWAYQ